MTANICLFYNLQLYSTYHPAAIVTWCMPAIITLATISYVNAAGSEGKANNWWWSRRSSCPVLHWTGCVSRSHSSGREAGLGPGTFDVPAGSFQSLVLPHMGKAQREQGREMPLGEMSPYLARPGAQRSPAHIHVLDPLGCVQPTRVEVINTWKSTTKASYWPLGWWVGSELSLHCW